MFCLSIQFGKTRPADHSLSRENYTGIVRSNAGFYFCMVRLVFFISYEDLRVNNLVLVFCNYFETIFPKSAGH